MSNSARWECAHDLDTDMYWGITSFGSSEGMWFSGYEITKEIWNLVGTYENDDYISERLIRKGRLICRHDDEKNWPCPQEEIIDKDYRTHLSWYFSK